MSLVLFTMHVETAVQQLKNLETAAISAAPHIAKTAESLDFGQVTDLAVAGNPELKHMVGTLVGGYYDRIAQLILEERKRGADRQKVEEEIFKTGQLIRLFLQNNFNLSQFRQLIEQTIKKLLEDPSPPRAPGGGSVGKGTSGGMKFGLTIGGQRVVIDLLPNNSEIKPGNYTGEKPPDYGGDVSSGKLGGG